MGMADPYGWGNLDDYQRERPDPGSQWSSPLYSCASILKASVKEVMFTINNTATLANLRVSKITPRNYSSAESMPLWAIENTGLNVSQAAPFWGVVDDKYEGAPSLWTFRSDRLYLPASWQLSMLSGGGVAGANGPAAALVDTYRSAFGIAASAFGYVDYSAEQNYPLYLKWKNLTSNPDTSSQMINLVWTDLMANYVLGANSRRQPHVASNFSNFELLDPAEVRIFEQKIRYDLRFAIPALIFLGLYLGILVWAVVVWVCRRATFASLRHLLNQTTTGRAVTVERFYSHLSDSEPSTCLQGKTQTWIQKFGDEPIHIRKEVGFVNARPNDPEAQVSIKSSDPGQFSHSHPHSGEDDRERSIGTVRERGQSVAQSRSSQDDERSRLTEGERRPSDSHSRRSTEHERSRLTAREERNIE